jgi:hypothetical protein
MSKSLFEVLFETVERIRRDEEEQKSKDNAELKDAQDTFTDWDEGE